MTDVLDSATGQVVDHPDGDIAQAWRDGKVQPIAGQTYHFRNANGTYEHADTPDAIARAVQQGSQFVSAAEAASAVKAQRLEREGGGALGAGAAEALSQGTFGLSDVAGKAAFGQEFADVRQQQQEEHPWATMLGGGVGAAGLAALTGGGSLAEQGAAGLAGEAAEGGLARIAQRAFVSGARAATEGAQMGVSQSISDAAIKDPQMTAQKVIANVGMNALWGGLLGGGFGAAGEGLSRSIASRLVESEPTEHALGSVATDAVGARGADEAAAGENVPEGLGATIAKGYAKLIGKDPDEIVNVMKNRQAVINADEIHDAASRNVRALTDDLNSANRQTGEVWQRGLKRSFVTSKLADVDFDNGAKAAFDAADKAQTMLEEMGKDPRRFGGQSAVQDALSTMEEARDNMQEAFARKDLPEMYSQLDDLKKGMGKYTRGAEISSRSGATNELKWKQNNERFAQYKNIYEGLRTSLEDENVWGDMGTVQKNINSAYTRQIDASNRFNSALTTQYGRDELDPWRTARVADPAKVDSYVRNLANPNQDLTHQAVLDYSRSSRELAGQMAAALDLDPEHAAAARKIVEASSAMEDQIQKQTDQLRMVNIAKKLDQVNTGNAMALGHMASLAGWATGHPLAGMALGKVADTLLHPTKTIRMLANAERMASSTDGFIGRALSGFRSGSAKASAGLALSEYPRRAAQIERLAADPAALSERIESAVGPIRTHSQALSDALKNTGIAGVQYLASKLPPKPPIDPLDPGAKPPLPPPAARDAFNRAHEAVTNPKSVIENLRDGRLMPEGVEALKTVYPSLYAHVQQQIFQQLSEGKLGNLSANQRYGLAVMTELPVPELDPSYIAARQKAIMAPIGAFDPKPPGAGNASQPSQAAGGKPSHRNKAIPQPKPQLVTEQLESAS